LILRRIGETAAAAIAARPDVVVIIDSPDFTHRVARRIRKAAPTIPIIDYVCPQVWAWRSGRAKRMGRYIDHVLAILPFEPAALERLGGPPCTYVGHPLGDSAAEFRPDEEQMRRRAADPPIILVLPGSRAGEFRRHADCFAAALGRVAAAVGPIELVLPTVPAIAELARQATRNWPVKPRIVVEEDQKQAAFRTARAALAASGTVTLELALARVPMVAAYRVAGWEAAIARRLIRVPSVILANLVLGQNVVPEFLQENCAPEPLAQALVPLVRDTRERHRQIEAFAKLDAIMQIGTVSPATKAADIVLETARKSRQAA